MGMETQFVNGTAEARRRGMRGDRLRYIVLPALLILTCHALLLYMFRLAPPEPRTEDAAGGSECVALLPLSAPGLPTWEQELYQWSVLEDPTLLILPHEDLGFSGILKAKLSLPVPLIPAYECTSSRVCEAPMPEIVLADAPTELALDLQRHWTPAPLPLPPEMPVIPLPRGVFWRFPNGDLPAEHPEIAEKDIAEILADGPLPKYATTIEIDRKTMPEMTRIMVRRTCGNAKLDRLAVIALRREITDFELHGAGPESRPPACVPMLGKRLYIEVEWTLASKKLAVQG